MSGSFFDGIEELLAGAGVPLMLSIFASIARFTRYGWLSLRHFLCSLITSIFVGQIVFWGLSYWPLDAAVDAAIVSISAYMGGSLLDLMVYRVKKEIRIGGPKLGTKPEEKTDE